MSILKKNSASQCAACGVCCELYGHTISAEPVDLERWRAEGREDILRTVGADLTLWLDPDTGGRLEVCPFLTRLELNTAHCAINATKPIMCRRYPTEAHRRRCVMGVQFHPTGE